MRRQVVCVAHSALEGFSHGETASYEHFITYQIKVIASCAGIPYTNEETMAMIAAVLNYGGYVSSFSVLYFESAGGWLTADNSIASSIAWDDS
jgi:hypothetical protein